MWFIPKVFFSEWLIEKARPLDFESLDEPELAQMLRQFYAELRTKSGNPYSTSGMRNIRAFIQRHLTSRHTIVI